MKNHLSDGLSCLYWMSIQGLSEGQAKRTLKKLDPEEKGYDTRKEHLETYISLFRMRRLYPQKPSLLIQPTEKWNDWLAKGQ